MDIDNAELSEDLLERAAASIINNRLQLPALLLLEILRPISTIGHAALLVGNPILSMILGRRNSALLMKILEERENLDKFCKILEDRISKERSSET